MIKLIDLLELGINSPKVIKFPMVLNKTEYNKIVPILVKRGYVWRSDHSVDEWDPWGSNEEMVITLRVDSNNKLHYSYGGKIDELNINKNLIDRNKVEDYWQNNVIPNDDDYQQLKLKFKEDYSLEPEDSYSGIQMIKSLPNSGVIKFYKELQKIFGPDEINELGVNANNVTLDMVINLFWEKRHENIYPYLENLFPGYEPFPGTNDYIEQLSKSELIRFYNALKQFK